MNDLREKISKAIESNIFASVKDGEAYMHSIGDPVNEIIELFILSLPDVNNSLVVNSYISGSNNGQTTYRNKIKAMLEAAKENA